MISTKNETSMDFDITRVIEKNRDNLKYAWNRENCFSTLNPLV